MYFGTPVWPLKWDAPYDSTIQRIHDLGFKGVELIGWNVPAMRDYYTKDTVAALKKQVADLGMVISNFNHTPGALTSTDPKLRSAALDGFKLAVDIAKDIGALNMTSVACYPFAWNDGFQSKVEMIKHIRHIPEVQIWTIDGFDMNQDFSANYEQYVQDIKTCAKYAGAAGLKLLIEPHPYRYVNSASSMLRLIEHVDEPNLGMNFDPSHLFPSGDMPQVTVMQMNKKIGHTHFSDNDTFTNVHWRPGKGKIDWYAVMKALKDVGYDGVISFELEDVPGAVTPDAATATGTANPMEVELKLSVDYIRGICNSLGIKLQ
jgi:sugar phosphate isomerase/epimerase